MKKIMLDPSPSFKTLILPKYGSSESNNDKIKNNFRYCSSGKSALASILAYLRYSGVLKDKMSTVLVPQWIGYEVYKTMTEYCFPTLKKDSDPKVMIVYHQYGFPQDMERILEYSDSKKIILIEDCAHALDSNYKDNRVGSFGDFSIYSFSKFVYCHALGGVGFKDSEFSHFFQDRFNDSSRAMVSVINAIKLLSMNNNVSWTNKILSVKFTNGLTKMSYSRYGDVLRPSNSSIGLYESKINKEKELRKYIYKRIRDSLSIYGLVDHLEESGVIPYAIPLMVPADKSEKLVSVLKDNNFETGVYFFDLNRFMLEPDFVKTVLIPCHSGISDNNLDKLIGLIKTIINN